MKKEEFDTLKVGDIISNKAPFTDSNNVTSVQGYDYEIIYKDHDKIEVKEQKMGGIYTLYYETIDKCLNLHKV